MAERAFVGLDNPLLAGRLRTSVRLGPSAYNSEKRQAVRSHSFDNIKQKDFTLPRSRYDSSASIDANSNSLSDTSLVQPAPSVAIDSESVGVQQLSSENNHDDQSMEATFAANNFSPIYSDNIPVNKSRNKYLKLFKLKEIQSIPVDIKSRLKISSKRQLAIYSMALVVFIFGVLVSIQTMVTNHVSAARVTALSKQLDTNGTSTSQENASLPSTTKPSASAVANYSVAPNLPKYLNIPALDVHARVMQVGVTPSGALGTPSNVYDTAWYTGSAQPGQPGATLIDGHVSSWTTHGVFYGLKNLIIGDTLQIIKGDNTAVNYQVVRTEVFPSGNVDMQSAITPVTAGKSGLNLITCTGKVEPGTSQFNERILVYAQEVN